MTSAAGALLLLQLGTAAAAADGDGGKGSNGNAGPGSSNATSAGGNGTDATSVSGGGGGGAGVTGGAGGAGGNNGGAPVPGGAGGNTPGANGQDGSSDGRGGGGGGGGAHGYVGTLAGLTATTFRGGNGGNGGAGLSYGGGGGGGAFGAVVTGLSDSTATIAAGKTFTGGNGGNGEWAASGGSGGTGLVLLNPAGTNSLTIGATITGGNGGAGRASALGGAGGAGLTVIGGTDLTTLIITGAVTGGTGGTSTGATAGGVGVSGTNLTVVLGGAGSSVSGGLGGTGIRAAAIAFGTGANALELRDGATLTGNVTGAGSDDVLRLGGSADSSFALGSLNSGSQLAGFGTVRKTGTSTWTLTGASLSTPIWFVDQGTLRLTPGSSLGVGAKVTVDGVLDISAAASAVTIASLSGSSGSGKVSLGTNELTIAQNTNTSYAGIFAGTGTLTKSGTGTLTLTGNSTHSGGTTISAGTLQIGNGGTSGSISGDVVNNGTLIINRSNAADIAGSISGTGSLIKRGVGTSRMNGDNSYTGATTVEAGILRAGSETSFGNGSALTIASGAELDLSGFSNSFGSLAGAGTLGNYSGIATVSVGSNNNTTTFSGGILEGGEGARLALVKIGTGTLTLAGANNYSLGTTIAGGVLAISRDDGLGRGGVTLAGGTLRTSGDLSIEQILTLDTVGGGLEVLGNLAWDGQIDGAGSLIKHGSGTLNLSGANTYTGGTTIAVGTLEATVTDALGTGPVSVAANAALIFSDSAEAGTLAITTAARPSSGNGGFLRFQDQSSAADAVITNDGSVEFADEATAGQASISGQGGITFYGTSSAGEATLSSQNGGDITFFDMSTAGTAALTVSGAGSVADFFDTATAGSASITVEDGAVASFRGDSSAANATIEALAGGRIFFRGNATAADATILNGGTLDISGMTGTGITIGSLTGDGAIRLGSKALTLPISGDISIAGVISDGGQFGGTDGSLIKQGSGTLVLSGANTYTGSTTIAAGTLQINGSIASNAEVLTGATLAGGGSVAGSVVIADGGHLAGSQASTFSLGSLDLSEGASVDVSLGAAGGEALFDVTGSLILDGTLNIADAGGFGPGIYSLFTYGGELTDNGLELGALPAGADAEKFFVQTADIGKVNLINSNGLELLFWDGGETSLYYNGVVDGGSGTWTATGRNWTDASGEINGTSSPQPGFVVFQGTAGTVVADDSNGPLSVSGMQFASDGYRLEGSPVELASPETIIRVGDGRDIATSAQIASELTGAGTLVKTDAGTLVLTGDNTYTGGTRIAAGALAVSAEANLGALDGDVTLDGGTLRVDGSFSSARNYAVGIQGGEISTDGEFVVAGEFTGEGALTKSGAGVLVLGQPGSAPSAYTGEITAQAGVLQVDGAFANAAAEIATGASLTGTGLLGAVTIADGGSLVGVQGEALSMASLALSTGSSIRASLGAASNAALFDITGALVLDGTLDIADAGGFGAGIYRLFDYGGALTDNGLAVGVLPEGVLASDILIQTAVADRVNLAVTTDAVLNFWDGGSPAAFDDGAIQGGAGTWTNAGRNWTTADGSVNGALRPTPGFAVFEGRGGTVTVDDTNGAIATGGMQFAVDGYELSGDAVDLVADETVIRVGDGSAAGADYTATIASSLTGSGALVKTDLGTLILSGDNTYTGGTVLGGGTLEIAQDSNLGAATGGLTLKSGVLRLGDGYVSTRSVTLDGASSIEIDGTAALNGTIGGSAGLVKAGNGTLTLGGANTYAGGTTVLAGTLAGSVGSIRGDIANDGTVVFTEASDSTFAGAVSGSGKMVKAGSGVLTLTGRNALDWQIDAGGLVADGGLLGGDVSIGANASLAFDSSAATSYAGVISGTGSLGKIGAGTLTLAGDSTGFEGSTVISHGGLLITGGLGGSVDILADGTLQVGNGGTQGALTGATHNNGTLVFARSDDYDYVGSLSGDGALIKRGEGLLTLSGEYSYTGSTVIEGGRIQLAAALNPETNLVVDNGTFDLGDRDQQVSGLEGEEGSIEFGGGTLTVNQSTNGTFGGSLEGDGQFVKSGSGLLNLTGTGGFSGTFVIDEGKAAFNGSLAQGLVAVQDGGAIGGNGTVGGLVVYNGGTAAPGNSIGTLHVAGDVTFQAGSLYQVELNAAGASDQVIATGVARIEGGAVSVLAESGDYAPASEYTILTASGGVEGTFDGVTTNLAFLAPSLSYSANSVRLSILRNDIDFASIAVTPNQRAAATAAEELGTASTIYDAVVRLSSDQAVAAFDSLSGEVHASVRTLMAQDAAQPRQAVMARIDGTDNVEERSAWLQPLGAWGQDDGDANAAAADRTTDGLMIGADLNANGIRLGVAGGFTRSHADVDARASEVKLRSGHAMAYVGADLQMVRLSAGAGYSWTSVHADRRVVAGGFTDRVGASYDGTVLQGFAEAGVPVPLKSAVIEPFAGFTVLQARTGDFAETGGAAALSGGKEKDDFAFSTVGVKLRVPDVAGLSLNVAAGWHHGFGDLTPDSTLAFAGGDGFEVDGVPLSKNSASFKSDVTWRLTPTTTFSAGYQGEFGNRGDTHGARVALSVGF